VQSTRRTHRTREEIDAAIARRATWRQIEGQWRRVARERDPVSCRPAIRATVTERGIAWRYVVIAGSGVKHMDTGYKDTQGQAMAAADECMATILRRGK